VASLCVRGRRAVPRSRIILLLLVGGGLMVAPDVTAEFVWRYQIPAVLLVPMAAALGWARLRSPRCAQDEPTGPPAGQETAATPSTD
jgi:hypothetical protein